MGFKVKSGACFTASSFYGIFDFCHFDGSRNPVSLKQVENLNDATRGSQVKNSTKLLSRFWQAKYFIERPSKADGIDKKHEQYANFSIKSI